MKYFILLVFFGLQSCIIPINYTPRYHEEFDKFKGQSIKSVEYHLSPTEKRSNIYQGVFFLTNTDSNSKMYISIYRAREGFYPEPIVYLKTQNDIIKLQFLNIENSRHKTFSENKKNIMLADSSTTSVIESISSTDHFQIKFEIDVDSKVKQQIINSDSLSLRIYSGGKSSTFEFGSIAKIKNVLN